MCQGPRIGSFVSGEKPSMLTRSSSEYSEASRAPASRLIFSSLKRVALVSTVAGPTASVASRMRKMSGLMNGSPPVK
jgi:hypothetical protein